RDINDVLGKLGHTDLICIADCGLPIPSDVKVVDLTLEIGKPSFMEALQLINKEMIIERIYLAYEISYDNPLLDAQIQELFSMEKRNYITHEDFKDISNDVKLIIRTGEATPYANIILQSGVIF
ncbi:MAG: D-ribose pyranase, partial [Bacilli bacterium]|nr:D-ribose pyranase [Bacilli bacterium]